MLVAERFYVARSIRLYLSPTHLKAKFVQLRLGNSPKTVIFADVVISNHFASNGKSAANMKEELANLYKDISFNTLRVKTVKSAAEIKLED